MTNDFLWKKLEISDLSILKSFYENYEFSSCDFNPVNTILFAKKYFGEINFMTRSHTDKEQLSSMFAFLHTYLKYSGKLNMLDENKVMEDIMCEVLNRVYGWHLVNLNTKEKNLKILQK